MISLVLGFTPNSSNVIRYDQCVFSGIVGNADFLDTFDHPSAALEGIVVSIYNLGCFTGCNLTFVFCERTGQKWAMWVAMVWVVVVSVVNCGVSWDEDIADKCRLAAPCRLRYPLSRT
jgi:hypothetical protein